MADSSGIETSDTVSQPPTAPGVLLATAWAAFAFIGPQFLLEPLAGPIEHLSVSSNIKNFIGAVLIQVTQLIIIWCSLRLYRMGPAAIGLRAPKPRYILLVLAGLPAYFVLTTVFATLARVIFGADLTQSQPLLFNTPTGFEMALSFIELIVITPIVEETIFRGFLYNAYRARFGFVIGTLLVSALFGIAHMQLNVGLDVFALSLVLCYIRERSNSLWLTMALHATKNLIAFVYLFIIKPS